MCGCHPLLRWVRLAVAVLLGASALAGAVAGAQTPTPPRMLVMPFDTGGIPRAWWLGEGSALLLAEDLRALGADAFRRDDRLRAFGRLQVPAVASLSHGTIIRVGQLLGATAVVIGSVALDEEEITVRARSIRLDTGRIQQEVEERGALEDTLAIFDRLARRLLPPNFSPEPRPRPPQPPLAAFENLVKGLLADTYTGQVGFLEKAIALHPAYDRARLELWRAHHDAEEHPRALAVALEIAEDSPLANRAQFSAAVSEIALKKFDEAFTRLQQVGELTGAAEVYNNIGIIQLRRGGGNAETGRATYWFNKAVQANPEEPDYCFNLGYAYWFEQDPRAALYWLREAVRRDPADSHAHFVLGAALHAIGSATEGDREFELARRLSAEFEKPDKRPPAERVSRGLERLREDLQGPGAVRPDLTLLATGQRDQRELARFHLERGRRFYERDNDSDAVAELRRALYLSPYEAEAHLLLGRTYLRSGQVREAVDALKVALWSQPSAEAHLALAEAYLQAREADAARREVERALALEPDLAGAKDLLTRINEEP
jgi:tetratricopeptide (TPR) repeat protein